VDSVWDEIDGLMAQIMDGDDPYPVGLKAISVAMSRANSESDLLGGIYLIWGSLTDGVELHPEDSPKYLQQMRQAAEEWLDLRDDDARRQWIDHWVYDVCGYARKDT
jgi:hypothetical protein